MNQEQLLSLSRTFEASGIFEVILYSILALSVLGMVILAKKGAL